jgi:polyisoprenoid-binding protein YceI
MTGNLGGNRWVRYLVAGVVVVIAGAVVGPFVYIHFIEGKAPAPLTQSPTATEAVSSDPQATTSDPTNGSSPGTRTTGLTLEGTWKVSSGSVAGYRVKEVLFGQSNEAVGRTNQITGSLSAKGTTLESASFSVDLTTVTSDQSRRDGQFNGRIMDTATYPTATFKLTQPVDVGPLPAEGAAKTLTVKGNLSLHGVTKAVSFPVTASYKGSTVTVTGSVPITFADFNINNPSGGPARTEDHGEMEFSLKLVHA